MWWSDALFPPKALHPQPQGWRSGKLTSPSLPQAPCYLLPGYLPKNRRLSRPVLAAKKNNSEILFSVSSTSHSWTLSTKSWLTVVFSLGKAQCWCNNANSWALTWQCLKLNASLILRKTSWETAGTSFCANLLPPEPYYRQGLLSCSPWVGDRTPKARTRGLAYSPSPCRLIRLMLLPGKQEADATFRLHDNWMIEGVVGKGRQLCTEE